MPHKPYGSEAKSILRLPVPKGSPEVISSKVQPSDKDYRTTHSLESEQLTTIGGAPVLLDDTNWIPLVI